MGTEDPAGSKGLLKWKGVMFAPDDGIDKTENEEEKVGKDTTDSAVPNEELEQGTEVKFSSSNCNRTFMCRVSLFVHEHCCIK